MQKSLLDRYYIHILDKDSIQICERDVDKLVFQKLHKV